MLTLTLIGEESWNEELNQFSYPGTIEVSFEHSLVSLSKWESIHEKPFLGPKPKTNAELQDYVHAMVTTPGVTPEDLNRLSESQLLELDAYINKPMTATTFPKTPGGSKNTEVISAELIYYWMNTSNIPPEYEEWHLNRLFTLIRVHSAKNQKPKKVGPGERRQQQRELNAQRRARLGSTG